ncbi:MAG: DNA polymerase III subunit alpha, partial [Nitrosomonas sp.]|nr:DNA polymerase III subunit alpha [Nitrosomonas sp.]
SLGGADLLRRAMGKKKVEEMAQQRDIFVTGAVKNELDKEKATELFGLMEKFAGYGFNKSHAAAYALIAYQTAYLKAHYPAEFMAACLSADMDDTDKVHSFITDSIANNLMILPPDINQSEYRFIPTDAKTIRYGLGAVKGTGESAIGSIIEVREQGGAFNDLFDFCNRVDRRTINRRVIEALISVGAFDHLNDNRASLLASVGIAIEAAEQVSRTANQASLFDDSEDSQLRPVLNAAAPWSDRKKLQYEKQGLGFYFSGHLFDTYVTEIRPFIRTSLNRLSPQREPQLIAGIILGIRVQMTSRGRMAVITLDDGKAAIELIIFDELFTDNRNWLKEDQLLIAEAKIGIRGQYNDNENSEELRITAEKLYDLAGIRTHFARQIKVRCNPETLPTATTLKTLILPYSSQNRTIASGPANQTSRPAQATCPVSLVYQNKEAVCEIALSEAWQVTLHDDLLQTLNQHFKAENITVIY